MNQHVYYKVIRWVLNKNYLFLVFENWFVGGILLDQPCLHSTVFPFLDSRDTSGSFYSLSLFC